MIKVEFTYALKRFFPNLISLEIEAMDLQNLITGLESRYPGMKGYLLEDYGGLRKHVNIFINGKMINDKKSLSDPIKTGDQIFIMQALSGG